ncbi:hypothetical protein RHGRI_017516 [Rhododendron griersonianum]|uniref:Uncharacterized protein n=1 Tax=Rhododendron griersonianum TaxID=479676 RepID=A0AAV6JY24_9ERIC|nr:hypothetical protein RHGRI_017516 [Rhododendron griersonianum]
MVCSRKPTSSTASPGPTLPPLFSLRLAALMSTATPPSTTPSTPPSTPPSTSLSLPPTLLSLSLSPSSVNVNCTIKSLRAPQVSENLTVLYLDKS